LTDFPDDDLLDVPNVIPIPHLGASTPRGRGQLSAISGWLEQGCRDAFSDRAATSRTRFNFPGRCALPRHGPQSHRRPPTGQLCPTCRGGNQITTGCWPHDKINIVNMMNKSAGELAYNIIDIDGDVAEAQVENAAQDRVRKDLITARLIPKA